MTIYARVVRYTLMAMTWQQTLYFARVKRNVVPLALNAQIMDQSVNSVVDVKVVK